MIETVVGGILLAIAAYLTIGIVLLVPLHRNWLAIIDPATKETRVFFRILVSPGLIGFWPLLLRRRRQATRGQDTAGSLAKPVSQEGLRRWHGLVICLLLVLCPAVVATALVFRGLPEAPRFEAEDLLLPKESLRFPTLYGQIFPSLPATVYLARDIGRRYVMVFRFDEPATPPPAALYWSETVGEPGVLPADAIFQGMVWGPKRHWIRLTDPKMSEGGYWILYSFTTHEAEAFQVPARHRGSAE